MNKRKHIKPPQLLWNGRVKPHYRLLNLDDFNPELNPSNPETSDSWPNWWYFMDDIEDLYGHEY